MKKSLLALASGTLGLGIAEFVMMGILPNVAHDLGISIPQAGHFISAYAIGVCVGAPLTVVVARTRPLKQILLGLAMIYIVGNLFASMSVNYWMLLLMRGGREREGFAGGVADDSGNDHCQSVWCAFRHDAEQLGFVAFPLCVQYPLGSLDILPHLAVDSVYARFARCGVERPVPFPETVGSVVDYPDHDVR